MSKRTEERKERLLPSGVPRWVRCYDNGGETSDRYMVIFTGRYTHKTARQHWSLCMSASPFSPQGIGMHDTSPEQFDSPHGKWPPAIGRKCHLGTRIPFSSLPADCQKATIQDYRYLWDV